MKGAQISGDSKGEINGWSGYIDVVGDKKYDFEYDPKDQIIFWEKDKKDQWNISVKERKFILCEADSPLVT